MINRRTPRCAACRDLGLIFGPVNAMGRVTWVKACDCDVGRRRAAAWAQAMVDEQNDAERTSKT